MALASRMRVVGGCRCERPTSELLAEEEASVVSGSAKRAAGSLLNVGAIGVRFRPRAILN